MTEGLTITDLKRMPPKPAPPERGDLHFDLRD
jgi:hypothetical protein